MVLAYDDAGTGEPAVVLLHGWGFGQPAHLRPLFAHLAPARRVLLPDLPGHGRSERPPAGFGFKACAAAIVAALDAAGVERAVVCGHSLGGRLAATLAADFPARVAAAALLDPVILFPDAAWQQALGGLVPALGSDRWLAALEGYFGRLLSPYDPPEVRARVMRELGQVVPDLAAAIMRDGMATDGAELLARLQCPLLVVRAGAPVNLDRLRELQPSALVGAVVGSGHWLTLVVPEQVNAMLDRFLELVPILG